MNTRERSVARVILAATLAMSPGCGPGVENNPGAIPRNQVQPEKPPLPPQNFSRESSDSKPPTPAWQTLVSENLPLIDATNNKKIGESPSTFVIDQGNLFTRDEKGQAVQINTKDGKVTWRAPKPGVIKGADAERFVFFSPKDGVLEIYDTKSKKQISSIKPRGTLTPELAARYFAPEPVFLNKVIAVPNASTGMGYVSGFTVYDKLTGKELWSSQTRTDSYLVQAIDQDKILAGIASKLYLLDAQNGTQIAEIPASMHYDQSRPRWAVNKFQNYLIAVAQGERKEAQAREQILTIYNTATKQKVLSQQFYPGSFIQNRNSSVCTAYCELYFRTVRVGEIKNPETTVGKTLMILADSIPPGSSTNATAILFVDTNDTSTWEYDSLITAKSPFFIGEDPSRNMRYSSGDLYSTSHGPYGGSVDTGRFNQTGKQLVLWESGNQKTYPNVSGVEYLGFVGQNYLFANWSKSLLERSESTAKIYALNIAKNEPEWVVDLKTPNMPELIIKMDAIWVIGESVVKIDTKTGNSVPVTALGKPPRKIIEVGNALLIETTDNRLIAIPLS